MISIDNIFRTASFLKLKDEGLSPDEAAERVRKSFPMYGNPEDTSKLSGADRLIPNELRDRVTLIATGGLRHSADVAKALALGAEAVYMAGALKIAIGCKYIRECHLGTCPYGIATQTENLRKRLDVEKAAHRVTNFINAATDEIRTFARICGKDDIHKFDKNDLKAINPELARITGVEMA